MNITNLDPSLGDFILEQVQQQAGCECHIILVVLPVVESDNPEKSALGQPAFITSLRPDEAEGVLVHVGEFMATQPERITVYNPLTDGDIQ